MACFDLMALTGNFENPGGMRAADPAFGMTRAELDAVMDPALYTGRCAQQVERFLSECAPLLADAQSADGAISL